MSPPPRRDRLTVLAAVIPLLVGRAAQGGGCFIAVMALLLRQPAWEMHGILIGLLGTGMVQAVTEHHHPPGSADAAT